MKIMRLIGLKLCFCQKSALCRNTDFFAYLSRLINPDLRQSLILDIDNPKKSTDVFPPLPSSSLASLAGKAGLEPATYGLENRSSIR